MMVKKGLDRSLASTYVIKFLTVRESGNCPIFAFVSSRRKASVPFNTFIVPLDGASQAHCGLTMGKAASSSLVLFGHCNSGIGQCIEALIQSEIIAKSQEKISNFTNTTVCDSPQPGE